MSGLTSIIIFGASGDLTRRKLLPALFHLHCKGRLPDNYQIVGVSRTEYSEEAFRQNMLTAMEQFTPEPFTDEHWRSFCDRLSYQRGDLTEVNDFHRLEDRLRADESANPGPVNRLYYLAISPKLYQAAVIHLGAAGCVNESNGWRRVIIEKPFGHDLASARALNKDVHRVIDEKQIYRIDHYLGKETVQNLLVFRFANSLFEPVWNRNYIDHVQITAAETVDVSRRAGYYDGVGVVRDMVQNHMMQLLALVAIEPPASFEADALRDEKVKLLKSIRPIQPHQVAEHTVRGQYAGYQQAEGVAPGSETATLAVIRLFVDNWRWQGVPFYLRSGKAMKEKTTQINILFKRPPHIMFPLEPGTQLPPNDLSICIQPDEGIHFGFQAKVPDTLADMATVDMEFHYQEAFHQLTIPDAYERLLLDALKGDLSLFTRGDTIELSWGLVDRIIEGWESQYAPPLLVYDKGSWGPKQAEAMFSDGYSWSMGCQDSASGLDD